MLRHVASGERGALDRLYTALYPDLKRLARSRLHAQGRAEGLGTTTLVHETFMRLVRARELNLDDRRHFFAYAAKTMRHVIVDEARAWGAQRRGAGAEHCTLSAADDEGVACRDSDALQRVHEALATLEQLDPELARTVDMRFFGGYSEAEVAELMGVSERTVRRRWDTARSWLRVALDDPA